MPARGTRTVRRRGWRVAVARTGQRVPGRARSSAPSRSASTTLSATSSTLSAGTPSAPATSVGSTLSQNGSVLSTAVAASNADGDAVGCSAGRVPGSSSLHAASTVRASTAIAGAGPSLGSALTGVPAR